MNEEIKVLLKYFASDDIHLIECEHKWCDAYGYEKSQMKKDLLDYITNLQQENERLKEQNNDLRKIYRNTYKKLFKKGNDELARYFQAQIDDCPTFYVEPIIDYAKEYKIYKSRCEKAIEYIKSTNCYGMRSGKTLLQKYLYDLLNILNGSDENE